MKQGRERIAAIAFVFAALVTMVVGWFTRSSAPISIAMGKRFGEAIFMIGMIPFTWTVVFLRKAFLGDFRPVTDHLVAGGPYRWVRHPLYLCMIIVQLGIGVAFRSLWGILSIPVLFLPAVVYRSRLEERALSGKFGGTWEEYTHQTMFLIPFRTYAVEQGRWGCGGVAKLLHHTPKLP